jgi:alanine dehydrogenase
MIIGIPKESWDDERRVALTPAGAYALTQMGHTVFVHAEAGAGSGFPAEEYRRAGATILFSAEEVFGRADLLVKVMPPTVEECDWIPEQKFIFSTVHLGTADPRVHEVLQRRHATAVGLEFIEDADHKMPVVTAMGEIAGMLLPQIAGRFLETTHGGRGVLLGGVAGIPASKVVIIGSGTVGTIAGHSFVGAGANVTVMGSDIGRLRAVEMLLSKMVNTVLATPYNIERYTKSADVVVGAVLVHRQKAPHVLSEAMVKNMRPGSVVIDVSIDHGGCVETSRPMSLSEPVFKKHGVTHYCVPNIPSSVARTASHALNNVVLSFVEEVADNGEEAIREFPTLRRGIYLHNGQCTHEGVAALLGWEYVNIDRLVG